MVAPRSFSANGMKRLVRDESFRPFAYYDTNPNAPATYPQNGTLTIGHGLTNSIYPVKIGDTITEGKSLEIVRSRVIPIFEKLVNDNLQVPVNQNQFDALVLHAYNTGVASSGLYSLINSNSDISAIEGFWLTHYLTGVGFSGNVLLSRRKSEFELFTTKPNNVFYFAIIVLFSGALILSNNAKIKQKYL